jgi:hypothetical protein
MLGRGRGIGDNGGHGRVWASVWCRWEGQIDCRSEEWQGLVGSPLHQVSRDAGRPSGQSGGATLSRGGLGASVMHWGGEEGIIRCNKKHFRQAWESSSTRRVFWGRGRGGDKNGSHRLVFAQGGQGMGLGYSGWHAVDDVPRDARPGGESKVAMGGPMASLAARPSMRSRSWGRLGRADGRALCGSSLHQTDATH